MGVAGVGVTVQVSGASGGAGYLDILQQVLHVGHGEAVEERVGLMHLHGQVVILGADVLGQQVDGLGPPVPDADLGTVGSREGGIRAWAVPSMLKTLPLG